MDVDQGETAGIDVGQGETSGVRVDQGETAGSWSDFTGFTLLGGAAVPTAAKDACGRRRGMRAGGGEGCVQAAAARDACGQQWRRRGMRSGGG
ncbi:hypothetical protein GCG21_11135 [Pseudactinotalea sp. HY160]|uniref:hypothetical protein n=1 Tax=Pseudactinotalea sp. HY160 TaxID=2654490 RepID=UPI00128E5080|nr:hypothetical protein [Pseudactinotalea sp. HY160]MPV50548.1 hypothetical protein [Pseudactinotalea sp. HY160]